MIFNKSFVTACFLFWIFSGLSLKAQEHVVPLQQQTYQGSSYGSKKVRLTLPFIDDFAYESPYPDTTLWLDRHVYINNSFSAEPPTRGMATFDGLNAQGRPYYPGQFSAGFADSLTSKPIDLSTYSVASSVYISFYVQPQGLGFAPESSDSIFLYFKKNNNQWVKVWSRWGSPWQAFRVVILPLDQADYFHSTFQFRFVNLASLNLNDDIWNLDYVKLDANRNPADTNFNDMAMTIPPGSNLFPYTSMPYRHFSVNPNAELATQQVFQIGNLYNTPQSVTATSISIDSASSSVLNNVTLPAQGIGQKSFLNQVIPSFPIAVTPPSPQSRVVIENKYFTNSLGPSDWLRNDTIVRKTIFDNYFAYDDGTAEKAYFLFAATNFPAKTAMQFQLNQADTIRGLQVFFAAQAPTAAGKLFSVVLYKRLAGSGFTDSILFQQDLFRVQYDTNRNGFITCAFPQGIAVPAGTYYIGITQPANFGSDSIYYGLDVNTEQNAQRLFYNVDGTWYGSSTPGTLMMRLLTGPAVTSTDVVNVSPSQTQAFWQPYPNPSKHMCYLPTSYRYTACRMFDLQGKEAPMSWDGEYQIVTQHLPEGFYVIEAIDQTGQKHRAKIIHLNQ